MRFFEKQYNNILEIQATISDGATVIANFVGPLSQQERSDLVINFIEIQNNLIQISVSNYSETQDHEDMVLNITIIR